MSKLSCKHKDLSQVIVISSIEVLPDLSVRCDNEVMKPNHTTSEDSSRKQSLISSGSSRKHNHIT